MMNKVAFLGPIMSRSKRFKSILVPDLDSTAKSNPRNNVLNIAGWFITKFCSSQSCLPCHDVSRSSSSSSSFIHHQINKKKNMIKAREKKYRRKMIGRPLRAMLAKRGRPLQ